MRKTISRKWLEKENACEEGIQWWEAHGSRSVDATLRRIHEQPAYAGWLVRHLIAGDKPIAVRLAVFSARMCLDNYTGDKTPLIMAIEAAEAVLENDCEETRIAARSAAESARSAADIAAWSASSAAWSAESAAASAAWSALRQEGESYSEKVNGMGCYYKTLEGE